MLSVHIDWTFPQMNICMRRLGGFLFLMLVVGPTIASPVLLISIDGLRPDYVTRADAHGLKIPNLRQFLSEGAYAEGVVGVVPTVTYPSHTTLVTGVWPSEHGVLANVKFDPLRKNADGWYWYAQDEKAPTLWQAAAAAKIVTASVNWPVTVEAPGIQFNLAEYWRAGSDDDLNLLEAVSRPAGFLADLQSRLGPYVNGLQEGVPSDAVRTRFAAEIIKTKKPGFMTVHLIDLDGESHEHGPFSVESNATLEQLDSMIGTLRDAALANDATTVVIVVSDHGFSRTDFRFNWRVPFIASGLMVLKPRKIGEEKISISSWDAELWVAGGSAAVMLRDPHDAALQQRVRSLLLKLKADRKNGIARVIEGDEARRLGGWPDASFLVELNSDYQFGNAWSGPIVTPAPATGMHGYLPDRSEMNASFFAMGHGVARAKNLGVIDMRQVAPTVARLLGVELPTAKAANLPID